MDAKHKFAKIISAIKKVILTNLRIECTSYLVLEWESIRRYDI